MSANTLSVLAFAGFAIELLQVLGIYYWVKSGFDFAKNKFLSYTVIIAFLDAIPLAVIMFLGNEMAKYLATYNACAGLVSIIVVGIFYYLNNKQFKDGMVSGIVSTFCILCLVGVIVVRITGGPAINKNIVEVSSNTYETRYEIDSCDRYPAVTYVVDVETNRGYYIVIYKSESNNGEKQYNVLNIPDTKLDIVIAKDDPGESYLVEYRTDKIQEDRSKTPVQVIINASYSYKIVLKDEINIINVFPTIQ